MRATSEVRCHDGSTGNDPAAPAAPRLGVLTMKAAVKIFDSKPRLETLTPTPVAGFSFIEVMVAMFLLTVIVFSVAELIGVSVSVNRAAADMTEASDLASSKMEELTLSFAGLNAGGSLDVDTPGFFDTPDVDGDGTGDYTRRWDVTDLGTSKQVRVRVIPQLASFGPAKEATIVALVAQS